MSHITLLGRHTVSLVYFFYFKIMGLNCYLALKKKIIIMETLGRDEGIVDFCKDNLRIGLGLTCSTFCGHLS